MSQSKVYAPAPDYLSLSSIVNEAGIDSVGSRASTTLEYGTLSGIPSGWTIIGAGASMVDYGSVIESGGTWKFQLTNAVEHPEGRAANLTIPDARPTVILQDTKGTLYEVPVSVNVVDDTVSIAATSSFKMKGGESSTRALAVSWGADGKAAAENLVVGGSTPITVDGVIKRYALEYGTLELNTDTSEYTFTANNFITEDSVRQRITFTAKDGDGDIATRVVTITVTKPDTPPVNLSTLVSEASLSDSSGMDSGYGIIHGLPEGFTIVGAGTATVGYGEVVNSGGSWLFTLKEALQHPDEQGPNLMIPHAGPTVIVEDAGGRRYEVPLTVTVMDDEPQFMEYAEGTVDLSLGFMQPLVVDGELGFTFGGDGPAESGALTWNLSLLPDLTCQGVTVALSQTDGVLTAKADGELVFTLGIGQDGRYMYTQYQVLDDVDALDFGLRLQDADGDMLEEEQALTLFFEGTPPPPLNLTAMVSESCIAQGTTPGVGQEYALIQGLPAGWTVVSAGSVAVDYGAVIKEDGVWKFLLTDAVKHPEEEGPNLARPDNLPTIWVSDDQGNRFELPLTITVIDDAPENTSYAEESVDISDGFLTPLIAAGELEIKFGADGPAATNAIQWDLNSLPDLRSNGKDVVMAQDNGIITALAGDQTVFTLSLNASGEYIYTQYQHIDDTDLLVFGLSVQDADGDIAFADQALTIFIEGDAVPVFTLEAHVSEAGLDNGSQAAQNSEYSLISGLPEGWTILGAGSTTVPYGSVIQDSDGWKFELSAAVTHPQGNDANTATPEAHPTVRVRDAQGREIEVELAVAVTDDLPTAPLAGGQTVNVFNLSSPVTVSGSLGLNFGADGAAASDSLIWEIASLATLKSNGQALEFMQSDGVLTAKAGTAVVFKLAVNENGDYTYTQYQALDNLNQLNLGLSLKDADGDSVTTLNALTIDLDRNNPNPGVNEIQYVDLKGFIIDQSKSYTLTVEIPGEDPVQLTASAKGVLNINYLLVLLRTGANSLEYDRLLKHCNLSISDFGDILISYKKPGDVAASRFEADSDKIFTTKEWRHSDQTNFEVQIDTLVSGKWYTLKLDLGDGTVHEYTAYLPMAIDVLSTNISMLTSRMLHGVDLPKNVRVSDDSDGFWIGIRYYAPQATVEFREGKSFYVGESRPGEGGDAPLGYAALDTSIADETAAACSLLSNPEGYGQGNATADAEDHAGTMESAMALGAAAAIPHSIESGEEMVTLSMDNPGYSMGESDEGQLPHANNVISSGEGDTPLEAERQADFPDATVSSNLSDGDDGVETIFLDDCLDTLGAMNIIATGSDDDTLCIILDGTSQESKESALNGIMAPGIEVSNLETPLNDIFQFSDDSIDMLLDMVLPGESGQNDSSIGINDSASDLLSSNPASGTKEATAAHNSTAYDTLSTDSDNDFYMIHQIQMVFGS